MKYFLSIMFIIASILSGLALQTDDTNIIIYSCSLFITIAIFLSKYIGETKQPEQSQ